MKFQKRNILHRSPARGPTQVNFPLNNQENWMKPTEECIALYLYREHLFHKVSIRCKWYKNEWYLNNTMVFERSEIGVTGWHKKFIVSLILVIYTEILFTFAFFILHFNPDNIMEQL